MYDYLKFSVEVLVVGIMTVIIGLIISYITMGEKAKKFNHWERVALSFFLTGLIIHLLCELTGLNKWYCKNGQACK